MHRPAPSDADVALGRAVEESPALAAPASRLRAALDAGDHAAAREAVGGLRANLDRHTLSDPARKSAERGLEDLDDALGPDAYWRAATWKRVAAIAAGPGANILFALVLFTGLFMTSAGKATTTVAEVRPDSPAATAGLAPGDRVVAIDGVATEPGNVSELVGASNGQPIVVVVERDGQRVTLPATAPERSDGAYRLGFVLRGEGLSLPAAARESVALTGDVTGQIVSSLGKLVTGEGREDISSPVGIVQGSSDAAKQGTQSFLFVLGLISLSIALLNLLPLLPLDGGHIVFAIAEGIRGRAVAREIYERVSFVGIGLVLLLFFLGLSNDVGRLS
jgi:regulator of sigma E protease